MIKSMEKAHFIGLMEGRTQDSGIKVNNMELGPTLLQTDPKRSENEMKAKGSNG